MLSASQIIEESVKLELGSYRTISSYMVQNHGIDYNNNPLNVELEKALEATMQRTEPQKNVFKWIDKDI